jgi:hypothetical protein
VYDWRKHFYGLLVAMVANHTHHMELAEFNAEVKKATSKHGFVYWKDPDAKVRSWLVHAQ